MKKLLAAIVLALFANVAQAQVTITPPSTSGTVASDSWTRTGTAITVTNAGDTINTGSGAVTIPGNLGIGATVGAWFDPTVFEDASFAYGFNVGKSYTGAKSFFATNFVAECAPSAATENCWTMYGTLTNTTAAKTVGGITVGAASGAATTTIIGVDGWVYPAANATTAAGATFSGSIYDGTTTLLAGVLVGPMEASGATSVATSAAGVYIKTNVEADSGTITTNYGLLVENQAVAGATNYAVKTGTGRVEFGDGVVAPYVVEPVLTTKTPAYTEARELYTNTGDADGAAITLTNDPTVGMVFSVAVVEAQTITITPSAGETLFLNGAACATSITGNDTGAWLTIVAVKGGSGGVWVAFGGGTWSCNS